MALRKEILEAHHRLAELEPAWDIFTAKHNEEEEAREQEHTASHSTARRHSRSIRSSIAGEQFAVGCGCRHYAVSETSRRRKIFCLARLSQARHRLLRCSCQCQLVLKVLELPVPLRPRSTPMRREFSSSTAAFSGGHVKDAHQEGTGSSLTTLLRREELIPDSMRKTTRANLETKTLKAFRNIFAHHKYSNAKISDWTFTPKCGREFVA